jgi:hypothetical protein|eukprot:evm.model.NODE_4455_length_6311_cov_54.867214.2
MVLGTLAIPHQLNIKIVVLQIPDQRQRACDRIRNHRAEHVFRCFGEGLIAVRVEFYCNAVLALPDPFQLELSLDGRVLGRDDVAGGGTEGGEAADVRVQVCDVAWEWGGREEEKKRRRGLL